MLALVLVAAAVVIGGVYGYFSPSRMEAGATPRRGRILGVRNGVLYGAAVLGLLRLNAGVDTAGTAWYAQAIFVLAAAVIGGFVYANKQPAGLFIGWSKGAIWSLAALTALQCATSLGWGTAVAALLLGWVGGFLSGGVLAGGLLMDFFQGSTLGAAQQHFTSHAGRYGAVTALLMLGLLTPVVGVFGALGLVVVSLGSGVVAGFLTADGKYAAAKK